MNRFHRLALVVTLFSVFALAGCNGGIRSHGQIKGILNGREGPIPDATVTMTVVTRNGTVISRRVVTDAQGHYYVGMTVPSSTTSFQMAVEKDGWLACKEVLQTKSGSVLAHDVTMPQKCPK